jgi:hypothetical protein
MPSTNVGKHPLGFPKRCEVFLGKKYNSIVHVIAQFVARSNGYKIEGQTGITGTHPTQCHHDGEVLSL